ncbi:hypothetical protein ACFYZN_05705 [Streptomyces sp. NPDC001777]|uniref:hypothetical protein n=1 Tax=Streptomyces sp. NPDC001777 TaxID=3364608 RepID=UPI0036BC387A
MSKVDFLDALAAWHQREGQATRGVDVEIAFGRTQGDWVKRSAWIELESQGRLGELIIWSTGEAEYMVGKESGVVVNEHHDLGSVEQLIELLDRLVEAVISTE